MRHFFAMALMFLPLFSHGQQLVSPQAQCYKEAYRAILVSSEFKEFREKERCVVVFDSIVAESQSRFLSQLGKHWNYQGNKKENRLRDSLDTADKEGWHKPYYSALVANLTATSVVKKGCVVILFSHSHNDGLLAEVSVNFEGGSALHNILSTLNQTVCYLLFFGPNEKVQRYYTQVASYN